MTTFWGPGVDAEIGYRMERTRNDFSRALRGWRIQSTPVPHRRRRERATHRRNVTD